MISVVIPLYNKRGCLLKTLDSVLAQSFKDYEVVIVDDGSTDGSLELVTSVADERVKVVSQANGGPSSARNRGIKESRGDYVAFIDADDVWTHDHLSNLGCLIDDFPDAVIYGMNYGFIDGGAKSLLDITPYRGYLNDEWNCFPFFFWTSSTCCSRWMLSEVGGFDERMMYGEDCDLWYRLLLAGKGAIDTKVSAYYNRNSENSLSRQNMPLEKHIPFFIDKYADARRKNASFRRFFDEQMVYRLYPYLFDKQYKMMALELARKLDYTQLKRSMKFRMYHPYTYRFLRSFKEMA